MEVDPQHKYSVTFVTKVGTITDCRIEKTSRTDLYNTSSSPNSLKILLTLVNNKAATNVNKSSKLRSKNASKINNKQDCSYQGEALNVPTVF